MNRFTMNPPAQPEESPEQIHGRRVFEATLASAMAVIHKGVPPGAVIAGLLGVVTTIGSAYIGARETRRLLMSAADSGGDDMAPLDPVH